MQPSAYCKVLAMFATSGRLYDASVDNLYSLMYFIMLLNILIIRNQLPRGGIALVLRLQPIKSSATGTKTDETVYAFQKTTSK